MKKIGILIAAGMLLTSSHVSAAAPGPEKLLADNILKLDGQLQGHRERTDLFQRTSLSKLVTIDESLKGQESFVLGKLSVEKGKRLPASYVYNRIPLQQGDKFTVAELQKMLAFYNSTNINAVTAELMQSRSMGRTDVILKVKEPKHANLHYFFVDNAGKDETGLYRTGYFSDTYGFFRNDDRFYGLSYISKGVWSGYMVYDTPISHEGTRAYFGYANDIVKIKKGSLSHKDFKGKANDAYAGFKQPLKADNNVRVSAYAEVHYKWNDIDMPGQYEIDDNATVVTCGMKAFSKDRYGSNYAKLSVSSYRADIDEFAKDNRGTYYNAVLVRRHKLPKHQYLQAKLMGQYSKHKDVPHTETFDIGGMYSVRGYEEDVLSGSKGWVGSIEYNAPLTKDAKTLRGFVFYDHGTVYSLANDPERHAYIDSCGAGLEFRKDGWEAKVALGVPVKTSDGLAHDKTRTHFFMQKMF